jgi:hypothetical protein
MGLLNKCKLSKSKAQPDRGWARFIEAPDNQAAADLLERPSVAMG